MIYFEKERSGNWYIYDHTDKNSNFRMHIHNSFEFVYVYEGILSVYINMTCYDVAAGQCILILPGQVHSFEKKIDGSSYFCTFSPDYVSDFAAMVESCALKSPVFEISEPGHIQGFASEKTNPYLKKSFLYYICGLAARGGFEKIPATQNQELIYKITEYISINYMENTTLKQMAADLNYNYTYLSNFFNNHFQTGFSNFLNEFRVNNAKRMLKETDLPMSIVAAESGFLSIRNFNRVFFQFEHISPKEYKSKK